MKCSEEVLDVRLNLLNMKKIRNLVKYNTKEVNIFKNHIAVRLPSSNNLVSSIIKSVKFFTSKINLLPTRY